jgi:hypothetical protein
MILSENQRYEEKFFLFLSQFLIIEKFLFLSNLIVSQTINTIHLLLIKLNIKITDN